MTGEERKQYIYAKIGEEFDRQLDLNRKKIIEYLVENKDNISINLSKYQLKDCIPFLNDESLLSKENMISIDNSLNIRECTEVFVKLFMENLPKDITKITLPNSIFLKLNLNELKEIKEVNLDILRLDDIISVLNSNINDIIKINNKIIKANNITFRNIDYKLDDSIDVYTNKIVSNMEKIFDMIANERSLNINDITITDDRDTKNKKRHFIKYKKRVNNSTNNIDRNNEFYCSLEINNFEDLNDIDSIIKTFENRGLKIDEVTVKIENKDYKNIDILTKINEKYSLKIVYDDIATATYDEFISMRATLDYYTNLIKEANLSNLEKIMFAYDLIKSFEYNEANEIKSESRQIHLIVKNGTIVCLGYASFLSQLLSEIGIENYVVSAYVPDENGRVPKNHNHARNLIKVSDQKYGVDGVYAFDATWDSAVNVVRCINENGKERLRIPSTIRPGETIIKHYDNLVSYMHFMVEGSKYGDVFKGEKIPNFEEQKHVDPLKLNASPQENTTKFLNSLPLSMDQFLVLLRNVKLKEGYSEQNIDQVINDIIEVNFPEKINDISENLKK